MLGIIGPLLEIFPLMETIRKKYKNIDICISENKDSILKNNQCKIIISLNDSIKDNNIINYYRKENKNEISLDNETLIEYIKKGNEQDIINYLKSLNIPVNKKILLNRPILIYIKHIINSIYSNEIVDRNEEIIEEIEIIKERYNIKISRNNKDIIIRKQ